MCRKPESLKDALKIYLKWKVTNEKRHQQKHRDAIGPADKQDAENIRQAPNKYSYLGNAYKIASYGFKGQ